jgi:hypothetical protein
MDALLWNYVKFGWPVFPCNRDKTPATKHGFKDATLDADQIKTWWRENAEYSIGLPTGNVSGVWVLDVDLPDGPATLEALEKKYGELPKTKRQQTGSGGTQYFFKYDPSISVKNTARKLGPGLDTRGDGGYVILPPSGHPSGGHYKWIKNGAKSAILPAPAWLIDLLQEPKDNQPARQTYNGGTSRYGERALLNQTDRLLGASQGERNNTLNEVAYSVGQLVAGGEIDEYQARAAIYGAAFTIGLKEREINRTIDSAFKASAREPRRAEDFGQTGQIGRTGQEYHNTTLGDLKGTWQKRLKNG